jgi:hypothetical protein
MIHSWNAAINAFLDLECKDCTHSIPAKDVDKTKTENDLIHCGKFKRFHIIWIATK